MVETIGRFMEHPFGCVQDFDEFSCHHFTRTFPLFLLLLTIQQVTVWQFTVSENELKSTYTTSQKSLYSVRNCVHTFDWQCVLNLLEIGSINLL